MIIRRYHWRYPRPCHCIVDVALMLLIVVGIVLLLVLTAEAQTLQHMEYFIDVDPGYGLATTVQM